MCLSSRPPTLRMGLTPPPVPPPAPPRRRRQSLDVTTGEAEVAELRAEVERLRASNRDAMQTCESYRAALRTADAETTPLREEIANLRGAITKAVAQREVLLDVDTTPALVFGMLADLRKALEG